MSTKFSHDLTYDAPMADVDAMLMDPAFRERVCDAQGAITQSVSITEEDAGVTVSSTRCSRPRASRVRQEVRRRRDPPGPD